MATNNKSTGSVTIVGDTAKVGATLLIGGVTIKDNDGLGDLHYQWLSNGSPIEQETGNRYTLTKNDIGKVLNVKISYTDGADNAEIIKSTNTKKVAASINNKPTGTIAITGDATKVGTELSITNKIKDKDGLGEFNYQWLRDGKAIDSATSDKYTLNQDDKGKTINLQVNYIDGAGYAETVKSTNTKKVAAGTTATTTPTSTTTQIKIDLSGPTSVNEGSPATYTATLTKALTTAISIPYTLSGTGITINGDEFTGVTSSSGNISIPAGSTTGAFTLNIINDLKTEGAETLSVKLGALGVVGMDVTLGTKSSVSTIISDTSASASTQNVTFTSNATKVNEGSAVTYTATLLSVTPTDLSIPYTLSGTGIEVSDFVGRVSLIGNIIIPAGSTTSTVTLNTANDTKTEGQETVTVTLGATTGLNLGVNGVSQSTTIVDTSASTTKPIVTLTSSAANVNEGSAVTYTATLSSIAPTDLSIPYTLSGTGITATDFVGLTSLNGNIIIAAEKTTGTLILNVANDATTEGQETVTVKLNSTNGVTLGTNAESQFTTIVDTSATANNSDIITPISFENAITFSSSNKPKAFEKIDSQIDWLNGADAVNLSSEYRNNAASSTNLRADFNGDGFKDIVVADFNSGGILLNLSIKPGLRIFTDFNLGVNPYFVGSGDFNNDGKLDIVTYNAGKTMSVLLNKGADINRNTPTTIDKFVSGANLIDLSKIDAKAGTSVDDAFILLPISDTVPKFTAEGQLRFNPATNTLEGHTTGLLNIVNFSIVLTGLTSVTATDFIL